MNKYRLTPINLDDPCWKYSDTTEAVIVEAENEHQARQQASHQFSIPAESESPGEDNPTDPWGDSQKTKCEAV